MIRNVVCLTSVLLAAGSAAAGASLADGTGSAIPNGTYRTSFTNDQLRVPGVGPEQRRDQVGAYTLKLANGKWSLTQRSPGGTTVYAGAYAAVGSLARVVFTHLSPPGAKGIAFPLGWSFDGKALHLAPAPGARFPAPVVRVVWTRHAWVKAG